jgi:hypothetical protein
MQPDATQIKVAVEAMRADAHMWLDMADEIREAGRVADRLDLSALHFSYIADQFGMTELYRDVREKMVRLLSDGADCFESLTTALRTAADGYEADEQAGVHRFRNIY